MGSSTLRGEGIVKISTGLQYVSTGDIESLELAAYLWDCEQTDIYVLLVYVYLW